MAVPNFREEACFIELDPVRLGKNLAKAPTIKGAVRYGGAVRLTEVQKLDLVVCGSVAVPHDISVDWIVTLEGVRCGSRYPNPRGIYWEYLTEAKVASIPVLRRLRGRLG